ncbi:MAG: TetR/AcrR family transcriptional regulator [Cyanobacteria bacterium P01_F01_bin.86]
MSHDQRRIEVADAAWKVIVREGLDRTSIRAIAYELGSSTAMVTHYFRNKDELTIFTLDLAFERALENMQASTQGLQGIERLERMIVSALPLEANSVMEWQVWVAFLGYAVGRKNLIQEHQKRYQRLQQIICQELADLQAENLIRDDLDLATEANAIIALVDGIGTGSVIKPDQIQAEQQRYIVRRHIKMLMTASST